ncbi:MAG: hypothetical protein ACO1RX_04355 [Candidatus Sericytochromatia bacterium]
MDIRTSSSALRPSPAALPAMGPPAGPAAPVEPAKQEVTLVARSESLTTQPLAQGQSVPEIPLVETIAVPDAPAPWTLKGVPPRPIEAEEMSAVLNGYNSRIKTGLQNAGDGSPLARFESTLKLVANLQDPRIKEDPQAWDILQMRRSQIEAAYQTQIEQPEVKALFAEARSAALKETFGEDLSQRARQHAAWLLSDDFQQGLTGLPEAELSAKVQQGLSTLAALDPAMAEQVAGELFAKTLERHSLSSLQAEGPEGEAARAGFGDALQVYLKTQQSALGMGMQASRISHMMTLSDEKMESLTKAVANLATGTHAKNPQELVHAMLDRVDELPADLRSDATTLIQNLRTQNVLGALIFAGSVAGLMRYEIPDDPKAWMGLTSASLGTAGSAHFGLRLLGFEKAADLAQHINYKLPVGSLKIPMLGAMAGGLSTAVEVMSLNEELANEDTVGAWSRAAGVGSSVASLAAVTLMSGPAAPVVLIGSTVVGLAAWGVNSIWGESDMTGMVRQQLRQSGVRAQEEALLENTAPGQLPATPLERVALINGLMDGGTQAHHETQIHDLLMASNDADFQQQMQSLRTKRLVAELEDDAQLLPVMQRALALAPTPEAQSGLLTASLSTLQKEGRMEALQGILNLAPPGSLKALPASSLEEQIRSVSRSNDRAERRAELLKTLLTHPDLLAQRTEVLAQPSLVQDLRTSLAPNQSLPLIRQLLTSSEPVQQELARQWLSPPPPAVYDQLSPMNLTPMSLHMAEVHAARLTLMALEGLSAEQLAQLEPELKQVLNQRLEKMEPRTYSEEEMLARVRPQLAA